ncbi:MAG TPA: OmpA family protein [Minicystis sp.]|nr:OmpA family protein [Minicystis sp.]
MLLRRRLAAALALAAASTVTAGAAAQQDRVPKSNGDGMDMHLFRPAVDSKGFFSVNGADILPHNNISIGLIIDYGHGELPLVSGHGSNWLLEHAFQGTVQFDYGIKNVFEIGIEAPVVLNGGTGVTDVGPGGAANYDDDKLNSQSLGFVALHAKLRLIRPDRGSPIGIAIIAQGGYGTGDARNFANEPGAFYWPQVVLERRFGALDTVKIALNAGYRGHTGKNAVFGEGADGRPELKYGVLEYANLGTAGFAASVRVLPVLDLAAETYASYELGGKSADKQKLSAEAIGGLKLFVERNSYLMLAAGSGYTPGFQTANVRGMIGFHFEPSIGDRDGDGIPDDIDKCPDDPEDFDGFQDADGCPDPDNDNDGIPDVKDRCPNEPENFNGVEDADGCPEANYSDRDGDGIPDNKDKCPDQPEDRDGFEDTDGCPDPDNDGDGIPDAQDRCPNEPEDMDGFQDADGCPDLDNDRDGIPDVRDKCPNEPETFNGFEDEDGCPDKGRVIIQENDIVILDKINFRTGSAEILPQSFGIVDAVAQTLLHHPEFQLVEVQGHADERGDDAMNLRLTQDRANAVVEALAKRGVDRKRMRSMGYGEYCPVDPAHNTQAWDKNRRVEFKVVLTDKGPTNVELGCKAAEAKGVKPPPLPTQ